MADCPCCVFNQQARGLVFPFLSMIALLFTSERGRGGRYQAHANAITRYLHSHEQLECRWQTAGIRKGDGTPSWLRETAGRRRSAIL